jgi:phosphoenolpyruvate synthase/pyruvate phosphate dikinase
MPIRPADAKAARNFGAEGIGLCRTEHMFFDDDRILAVREMILADDEKSRRKALDKLLPAQRSDFIALFETMKGLPVTIRLLDPPLHEFLPHTDKDMAEVASALGTDVKKLAGAQGGTFRVQSDARLPWLPSCDCLPGNRRDAGARDFRSRRACRQDHRRAGRCRKSWCR